MTCNALAFRTSFFFAGIFLVTALEHPSANAKTPDYSIHQDWISTRAMGMGNAFIAVADDQSTMFYNPALLYKRTDGNINMFVRAGVDTEFQDFVEDVDKAGDDATQLQNVIEEKYGEHLYARAPTLGFIWSRPKWAFAFIPVDLEVDLAMHRSLGPSVFANATADSTIAYAHAYPWKMKKGRKILWGYNLKLVHRLFYSDIVQSAQLATGEELYDIEKAAEGLTLDFDLGLSYDFTESDKAWFRPTVAFVIRNVADYGFPVNFELMNDDPQEPPKLQRRFDVGTKLGLPRFWVFDPKIAVDMRDMGHENFTMKKGFHAGAEMAWTMFNWWKGTWSAGINQGYATLGVGAKLAWFRFDLATWGEEVGTSDAPVENRRYMADLSLDF
jgi:hypothetical protein